MAGITCIETIINAFSTADLTNAKQTTTTYPLPTPEIGAPSLSKSEVSSKSDKQTEGPERPELCAESPGRGAVGPRDGRRGRRGGGRRRRDRAAAAAAAATGRGGGGRGPPGRRRRGGGEARGDGRVVRRRRRRGTVAQVRRHDPVGRGVHAATRVAVAADVVDVVAWRSTKHENCQSCFLSLLSSSPRTTSM